MANESPPAASSKPPATGLRKKSRTWIWIFGALFLLGSLAVLINYGYNLQQQLTPAELQAARQRWDQHGPANYDLRVQIRRHSPAPGDPAVIDNYSLQIRDGKVTNAVMNDAVLERRYWDEFDMPGLFDSIDEFLRRDRKPGQPQTFLKGTFDRRDGRLLKFIRRVRGSTERLEIVVVLEKR